jgi:hypothetical protein
MCGVLDASTRVAARVTGVGVGGRGLDLELDLRQARPGTGVKIDGGQVLLCSALRSVRRDTARYGAVPRCVRKDSRAATGTRGRGCGCGWAGCMCACACACARVRVCLF